MRLRHAECSRARVEFLRRIRIQFVQNFCRHQSKLIASMPVKISSPPVTCCMSHIVPQNLLIILKCYRSILELFYFINALDALRAWNIAR